MSNNAGRNRPQRQSTLQYVLVLGTLALIAIFSQTVTQYQLALQATDARVINIAGRQRTLSQRISKAALGISSFNSSILRERYRAELAESLILFERSQLGLQQGDAELGLPGRNSPTVTQMFAEQQPHYVALVTSAGAIRDGSGSMSDQVLQILDREAQFLSRMDAIVFQYDSEARASVVLLQQLQLGLLGLMLATLLLQGLFIFRPAIRRIEQNISEIEAAHEQATTTAQELAGANTELAAMLEQMRQHEAQQQYIIRLEQQQEIIRTLSTPIVPIAEGVIVLPLIGALDAERGAQLQHTLLHHISEQHAHTVIVDVTGMVTHDSPTIATLLETATAARLLGTKVVFTGIRPQTAAAFVNAQIKLDSVRTFSSLQQGIAHAMRGS
ncbi:MAG: STAS domain-containing protein [Chloroflexaceae bacterium]|nr:STAS domain-containing protein [Chloroflexaceae bacterium]